MSADQSLAGEEDIAVSQPRSSPKPEASIVLIGIRGTGKSTLAVIASLALNRRLIDADAIFKEETGQTPSSFRDSEGATACHQRQREILRVILDRYDRRCVIVVGAGWMDHGGADLVREFAVDHAVIHVLRDASGLSQHLGLGSLAKAEELLNISGMVLRSAANFEFFNLTEPIETCEENTKPLNGSSERNGKSRVTPPPTFLALKRTELLFRKFLTKILAPPTVTVHTNSYPLSRTTVEGLFFTSATAVTLEDALNDASDIELMEVGADALEIVCEVMQKTGQSIQTEGSPRDTSSYTSRQHTRVSEALARVRREVIVPIILHPVAGSDATKGTYMDHLRHCFRLGPEFMSIDLGVLSDADIIQLLKKRGEVKIIGHFNDEIGTHPGWNDNFWLGQVYRAKRLGCDVVRLLRRCHDVGDNFAAVAFREKVQATFNSLPLIAYNTTELGRLSMILNPVLTSTRPGTAQLSDNAAVSKKQGAILTPIQVTRSRCASFVVDPMKFYVFGASTAYSVSPAMHNAGYQELGLPHHYRYYKSSCLDDFIALTRDSHFGGSSLSLPFKTGALPVMDYLSKHANAIGAINTVVPIRFAASAGEEIDEARVFRERNRAGPVRALYGENTDWIGIRACIGAGLSPANMVRGLSTGLVIGAGGMARATIYAMITMGVRRIVIHNRTARNAEILAQHFIKLDQSPSGHTFPLRETAPLDIRVLPSRDDPWPQDLKDPAIIVSCIPTERIGEVPSPEFTLPEAWMKSPTGGVVVELGYKTLQTPLLQQIRSQAHRGWTAMDGLDLVPEQGFPQFELFTGRRAPRRMMRVEALRSYKDASGQAPENLIQARLAQMERQ